MDELLHSKGLLILHQSETMRMQSESSDRSEVVESTQGC